MTSPQDDAPGTPGWASPAGPGVPPPPPSAGWGAAPVPPAAPAPPGGQVPPAAPVPPGGGPVPPAGGWGGAPTPPGWGTPPTAGWGTPPTAPGGGSWQPPAVQPGIVPLRPLGLGEILDGAVRAVRANPSVMFGLSAAVVTVAVALQTLVQLYVSNLLSGALTDLSLGEDVTAADAALLSGSLAASAGQALTAPLLVPVTSVLTGLLIVSVSRSVLGEKVALREVWRARRVWFLVAFALLQMLAGVLAFGLWLGAVAALAASGADGAALAVLLVGALPAFAVTVWVTTRTLLVPPALMLEGAGFWRTVARAWRLTRGSFWRLLGIYLLSSLLVSIVMYLVIVPVGVVAGVATAATGSMEATILLSAVGQVVALTLTTTFLAAVVALLYVDVRIRREGLDLELARAAGAA